MPSDPSSVDGAIDIDLNPVFSNEDSVDGATGVGLNPVLSILVEDFQGDTMNVTFRANTPGSWETIGSNISVSNGTYSQTSTIMNQFSTTYYWSVNCTDGNYWTNETFSFTTEASLNNVPIIGIDENPKNESTGVSILTPSISVNIKDPE